MEPALEWSDTTEVRAYEVLEGSAIPTGDDVANFDSLVFPSSPADFGMEFEIVTVPAPIGDLEAWYVDGTDDTWVIGVHGLGPGRRDTLRLISAIGAEDHPILAVSYRNDEGAPQTDDRLGMMGQTEWEDIDAAVSYARSQGARAIVLDGISMGGAVVLSYLMNAEDTAPVVGAILESPVTDFREVVSLRSGEALPIGGIVGDWMLGIGRAFVWMRTGLDFDDVDYVERADELDVPVLLLHGTDDDKVPYEVGEALASARPDLVRLETIQDAAHVRAWNEDPEGYRATLLEFIESVR